MNPRIAAWTLLLAIVGAFFVAKIWEATAPASVDGPQAGRSADAGVGGEPGGDLPDAEVRYQRALDLWDKLGSDQGEWAATLSDLVGMAKASGESAAVETHFQRVFEHVEKQGGLVSSRLPPASPVRAGKAPEATNLTLNDRCYRHVLDVTSWVPGSPDMAITSLALAAVARRRGDLTAAETYLGISLYKQKRLAPYSINQARMLHARGELMWKYHRLALAEDLFSRAIGALEGQIERLGGSYGDRGSLRARYGEIYKDALAMYLDLGDPGEAFHILELFRARSFLEMLAERDVLSGDLPPDLKEERRRIAAEYDSLQRRISDLVPGRDDKTIEQLSTLREELYRKRDRLVEEIRKTSPELAAVQYPVALDFRKARSALDPGTVMLSYSISEASTEVFVIASAGDLRVETLPVGEKELRDQVQELNRLIPDAVPGDESGATDSFRFLAGRLYRRLVEPVAGAVAGGERLLIIPDGPLHVLPWGALIRETGENAGETGRGWQYLVEWKPLHTALSATVYAQLKQGRRRHQESGAGQAPTLLAAFGDPVYPGDKDSVTDFQVRSAIDRGLFDDWNSLPHTRREVEQIAALYPPAARRTHLGARATEEAAKAVERETRIVHLATHGHLDDRFPLDSALVLTIPEDPGQGRDNGLLQVWEIFERLRLNADLVVLSACASALGEEQGGEGLIGLTRAFQVAGARSVAASLWSVQDRATAELMVRFHRHMNQGRPNDEALRQAQLELIRGPIQVTGGHPKGGQTKQQGTTRAKDYSAPYYWAAFGIYGDWLREGSRGTDHSGPGPARRRQSEATDRGHGEPGRALFFSDFNGSDELIFPNDSTYYSPPGFAIGASSNGRIPGGWKAGRDDDGYHEGSDPWLITEDGIMRYQAGQGMNSDHLYVVHPLAGIPDSWFMEVRFIAATGEINDRPRQFIITDWLNAATTSGRFMFAVGLAGLELNGKSAIFPGLDAGRPHVARIWSSSAGATAEVYLAEGGEPEQLLSWIDAPSTGALERVSLWAINFTGGELAVDRIVVRELEAPR